MDFIFKLLFLIIIQLNNNKKPINKNSYAKGLSRILFNENAHFFYKLNSLSCIPSLFYCPSTMDKHRYTTCKLNLLFRLLLSRIKSKECFFKSTFKFLLLPSKRLGNVNVLPCGMSLSVKSSPALQQSGQNNVFAHDYVFLYVQKNDWVAPPFSLQDWLPAGLN